MLELKSAATPLLVLLLAVYVLGCGLATMLMAKRNGLDGLGSLGGFLVGAIFHVFGVLFVIFWIMIRDDLKGIRR